MNFLIFTNVVERNGFVHKADGGSPKVLSRPDDFAAPSFSWQPLDEPAHKCLMAYAERKWAAFVDGLTDAERAKVGNDKAKARYIAERVKPMLKGEAAAKVVEAATVKPKDSDEDFAPMTLREFAGGRKK